MLLVYVFGADCLVLVNQLVWFALGKTVLQISPFLSSLSSLSRVKAHELSLHMLAHVSVPSMLSACWGMHVGETFGCSFWHSPERLSHSKFPGPLALTVFLPSLPKWLPSLRLRSWVADLSAGTALHNSAFWLIVIFCTSLHLSPASFYIKLEGLKNEMA